MVPDDASKSQRHRIPGSVRAAVLERDGKKCQLCGGKVVTSSGRRTRTQHRDNLLTLDHIVAVSRGGLPTVENLRVACRSCNMKRSSGGQFK